MGAWFQRQFSWHGNTSREEYRRWLPLIIAVDLAMLWAVYEVGARGRINLADFGWPGVILFMLLLAYYIGWLFLTARRLRSANISRSWLIFVILSVNLPVGNIYVNFTQVAALLLTAVAALARERDSVSAA